MTDRVETVLNCAFSLFNDVYKLSFYDIATMIEEYC
jgi:hypothetical protein